MSNWKIGGVQLELREDGTFFIYQPDSNRVLTKGLALQVADYIRLACDEDLHYPDISGGGVPYPPQPTVGEVVEGPGELTATELEADKNAADARASIERGVADVEAGRVSEPKPAAVDETVTKPQRQAARGRRPRKAQP